jgi:hypothetical protein
VTQFETQRIRHIQSKGRPVTLKRGVTTTAPFMAFFNTWSEQQMAGTVLRQGDVRIELLTDIGVPAPPRDPDLIIDPAGVAYTILFANPIYDGPLLIGWCCAARAA